MEYVQQLISNRIIITGVVSWAAAQILKTVIFALVNHTLRLERLLGDGGMPSAHSAAVTAVAVATGFECGFDSAVFAVAFFLAVVVMHDAAGVRLESGKQAKAINDLMALLGELYSDRLSPEDKLKEFIGHTPLQVAAGLCLGLVVALIMNL